MRIPGPNDLFNIAGAGYQAAERAIALVPRLVTIVGQVEQLMVRVHTLIGDIETTNGRAAAVVGRTETVVTRVETVVGRTEKLTGELVPLMEKLQPSLVKLEPMVARLASTTSPAEVDAVVGLVDTLPDLSEKVRTDILPVLDTLGTVAPDLRELLDISKDLNEMLGAIPGLGRIKKKIEERQELADDHQADETPPAAPDRQS